MEKQQKTLKEAANKQRLFILLLPFISLLLCLILLEIALRLFAPQATIPTFLPTGDRETFAEYDPLLGWKLTPLAEGPFFSREFFTHITINAYGFRDATFVKERDSENERIRIAVIGDSYAWGYGVEENETFASLLENYSLESNRSKKRKEVLNFAVTGYGTDQFLLQLNTTVISYQPDVIMITFHGNDLENAGNKEQYSYPKPMFIVENESLILTNVPVPEKEEWDTRPFTIFQKINFFASKYSHAWIFIKIRIKNIKAKIMPKESIPSISGYDLYKREYTGEYKKYEELQRALYKEIAELAQRNNIRLIILYIPSKEALDSEGFFMGLQQLGLNTEEYDREKPGALIKNIGKENNIEIISLYEPFQTKTEYYFKKDPHWNVAGHKAVADYIAAYLSRTEKETNNS